MRVKVVTGDVLAALDTTGTLTQKYQARFNVGKSRAELITPKDTDNIYPLVSFDVDLSSVESPTSPPVAGQLLSISIIFKRLEDLSEHHLRTRDRTKSVTVVQSFTSLFAEV